MAKYLLTYHGGGPMPESEEEVAAVYQAWSDWLGSAGDNLVDGGNPISHGKLVAPDGAVSDANDAVTGYSIVNADSIDDAVVFAKSSPHIAAGGTVGVRETVDM